MQRAGGCGTARICPLPGGGLGGEVRGPRLIQITVPGLFTLGRCLRSLRARRNRRLCNASDRALLILRNASLFLLVFKIKYFHGEENSLGIGCVAQAMILIRIVIQIPV